VVVHFNARLSLSSRGSVAQADTHRTAQHVGAGVGAPVSRIPSLPALRQRRAASHDADAQDAPASYRFVSPKAVARVAEARRSLAKGEAV